MTLPAPEIPRRRDAEATRRRLIGAALDLFTTAGFSATTTPMLSERAGIAEGTIYRHFSGKAELLNAAYREAQDWGTVAVKAIDADRSLATEERLRGLGRRILVEAAGERSLVRMLLQQDREPNLDERSRERGREFRSALQLLIAGGKSDGVIRAGPADLWAAVWLAVVEFAAERVAVGEWTPEHPQAALALDAAWDAIATASPQKT